MSSANPYKNFDKFIFRIPFLPRDFSDQSFLNSEQFKESIYLASPDLFKELFTEQNISEKELAKLFFSKLKYFVRMSTRCTPFGIFAGVGIGEIGKSSAIAIDPKTCFRTSTRLDMRCMISLLNALETIDDIKSSISFFPNNSLYRLLDGFRYAEHYADSGTRDFQLSQIDYSEYLAEVLKLSEQGETLPNLILKLEKMGIERVDASEFIDDLIANQVIVSEFEPALSCEGSINKIVKRLEELSADPRLISSLKLIDSGLTAIDQTEVGRSVSCYRRIEDEVKKINPSYQGKFFFQSDMYVSAECATLDEKIIDEVREVIDVLNKLTPKRELSLLSTFKEKFYARYEEEEIPLIVALDSDIGIGFQDPESETNDLDALIKALPLPASAESGKVTIQKKIELLLLDKYSSAIRDRKQVIHLTQKELENFPSNWEDLPRSLSGLGDIVEPENNEGPTMISIPGLAGSSGANLIARFAHLDEQIDAFCSQIIAEESAALSADKVFAEIIHLPDERLGNVLLRPHFRQFEIPYLGKSVASCANQISINDLYISVPKKEYVRLRSKKLNKEIIPRLTTAHNYFNVTLPIYQFLCLLQSQGLKSELSFNWGQLLADEDFLPRVQYKNVILSPAKWVIHEEELKDFPHIHSQHFYERALTLKNSRNITSKVSLIMGDNKLFIDFDDPQSVQLLFSITKNRSFSLEEYLFTASRSVATGRDKKYNSQVVFCYFKN
ncbi:MAG TPA: lantibiotic dehydratase family protein [Puia sp.]|nr:lantibiotic dehydratase family protein [Puia sp.]